MPGRAGFAVYRAWMLAKKLWWPLYTWLYIYICCARAYSCIVSPPILGRVWWHSSHFFHPSIFFVGVYWFCRCERFFCAFFSMFLQTIKFFGCSTAMYDSLLSYIILDDVISLQHSCTIQGIPCKLKVAIWVIYMSEKSMLGSWNRAFSIEFEKSIRKQKKIVYFMGYET